MKLFLFICLVLSVDGKSTRTLDRNPRVVGGENAKIEEFPALVAIIHTEYRMQWCAGTLISEQWVMTAAHCWIHPEFFVIEYSTTDLLVMESGAKQAAPELFIQHENFDYDAITFDIGLIKLKEPLFTGLHVPLAKLAVPGNYYSTGTPATVAGWGVWNLVNRTEPPLQKANLEIWHYRECQEAHRHSGINLKIHPSQICAGLPDFSKAECNGDSGGPLYVNGVQVGIVSWSLKPCTVAEFPGVYTDVSYFIPWIKEKTGLDFELETFLTRKK